jgi:hypothetical protein
MVGGRSGGAWQVPNSHHRLARGQRLSEQTEKARLLGRPPERREVGHRRALAPPCSYFGGVALVWKVWQSHGNIFQTG